MTDLITKEQADALHVVGQVLPGVPEAFRAAAQLLKSIHGR